MTELGFNSRTARDVLERMERGGYIRRFATPGIRHCYPILIHKFPITQGEHDGEVLDALASTKQEGFLNLKFISCEVHGEVHASQRRIENGERRIEEEQLAAAYGAIGFEKPFGQKKFQAVWLRNYSERKPDQWLTITMEDTIQQCQREGIGVPPQFYDAKRDVEGRENSEYAIQLRRARVPL